MKIEKVNLKYPNYQNTAPEENKINTVSCSRTSVQKSLYTEKGVYIPFCGLAKGQDFIEETCIKMLRKVREHRYRKFAEDDIREILTDLRKVNNPEEKPHIIQEALTLENENSCESPSKHFVKRVINLTAGKPEDERFAILEFAQHELNYATEPLAAFSKIPEEKQTKLLPILKQINEANDTEMFNSIQGHTETITSLYDIFRTAVYAHDDISKLSVPQANAYKVETLKSMNEDKKFMEKLDFYADKKAKENIISIVDNVMNYFIDNIL